MATHSHSHEPPLDPVERELSRGGKNTAIFTWIVAVMVISIGTVLALALRHYWYPPARPGSTNGVTTSGAVKPGSPQ
jgi:hypothetical protein